MSCCCTTRTLRLFIRNVAQLDLATSTSSSSPYRLRRSNIRRFNVPSVPSLQPLHSRAYSTAHSFQPVINTDQDAPTEGREELSSAVDLPRNTTQDEIEDMDDFFLEITPESIDALAAETKSELATLGSRESMVSWESDKPRELIRPTETWEDSWVQREPLDIFSRPMKKARWNAEAEKTRFRSVQIDNAVSPNPQASTLKKNMVGKDYDWTPPLRESWMVQKAALKEKFPEGWKPMKRLSPEAQAGIRALHAQYSEQYSTAALADHFEVSAEAIRRILRTNWVPTPEEESDRERRWFQRGKDVWTKYAELGVKPPRKWREEGIGKGKPEWKKRAIPTLTTSRPGNSESQRSEESDSLEESDSFEDEMEDRIF
ncbi:hypothetical protein SBOR_3597 [Sclerotinia borealis F-4128]|uniref:Required for respiratory growth protein 9, mitochondrial n=1 Tax=Sclerotinia borealis (strain F-4128) TaxID=1432307 RepID=W9CMZ5_SCLBF|nr:hypothetical protein SBOR_3597 [Sclerotinia borealis F-4128]